MLKSITIKNFAIVDSVSLEFGPGFNVLTGETGAGKSLIVDALHFLLGDRIDLTRLRQGEERALVEALFQIQPPHPLLDRLREAGFPADGGEVLLKREFTRSSGKTRSFLNGETATAALVSGWGDLLVDIHGQHEHQAIFNPSAHRRLVDGSGRLAPELEKTARAARALQGLLEERDSLGGDSAQVERRMDLLTFQVREIADSGVLEMDEDDLQAKFQRSRHAEKIAKSLTEAQACLDTDEGGADGSLRSALARLREAAKFDPALEDLSARGDALRESLGQFSFDLGKRLDGYSFSEPEFQELSDQIDLLHKMKKKYGSASGGIQGFHDGAAAELASLRGREARLAELEGELQKAARAYAEAAAALSAKRREAGEGLARQVEKALGELGLANARLGVAVTPQESADSPAEWEGKALLVSPQGWDRVEFLFSANPGEPLRPLAKVASGGEASRVMLALKTVLADGDDVPTLIFDEIDTGVGARTAPAVSELLRRLARSKQVLCISHLAPIAGLGDWHFQVSKSVEKGSTSVRVIRLTESQRIEELAKMLGGEPLSETSLSHAKELYVRMRTAG